MYTMTRVHMYAVRYARPASEAPSLVSLRRSTRECAVARRGGARGVEPRELLLLIVIQRGATAEDRIMVRDDGLDFDGWDGTPGDQWEKYSQRLFEHTTKTDDRGWSLADHLRGADEGAQGPGATGPAHPPAANHADLRKSQAAYRKRQKESYGILIRGRYGAASRVHLLMATTLARMHPSTPRPVC